MGNLCFSTKAVITIFIFCQHHADYLWRMCFIIHSSSQSKITFDTRSFPFRNVAFCAFNTLIAYGAFSESLEHWEASRVSAVIALAPVVTLIAVAVVSVIAPNWIPSEHFSFVAILGAGLVVTGSVAIALGKAD